LARQQRDGSDCVRKCCLAFGLRPGDSGGIGKGPVKPAALARKYGARLRRLVADGDDDVERLIGELFDVL
jgi:hypothetical protein